MAMLSTACAVGSSDVPQGPEESSSGETGGRAGRGDELFSAEGPRGPVEPAPSNAPFTCRQGAFCDDFEKTAPASGWTRLEASGGALSFEPPSASSGLKSLRATTTDAASSAYLVHEGEQLGGSWSGAFGSALRLGAMPTTVMAASRVVVVRADGVASVGIVIVPEGIRVEQHDSHCAASSCRERSDLIALGDASGAFHRFTLGFEVQATTTYPYGRVELSIDGEVGYVPLDVPLARGNVEIHLGVTRADDAPIDASFDDALFFVR